MANYPQELAQDAVCESHTGHMTGLWFLPARPLRLNTNERMKRNYNFWKLLFVNEKRVITRSGECKLKVFRSRVLKGIYERNRMTGT